jgi:hypothetical protein
MPTFDTPQPISATIQLAVGDARLTAGDRTDTVVEVRPSDPSQELDVQAAEQTRVEFSAGHLLIRTPKQRGLNPFGKVGSVDLSVELPAGSQVDASGAMTTFRLTGRLGECRLTSSAGDIQVDEAGPLEVRTAAGEIVIDHVVGDLELSTATGRVRVRDVDGAAVIKNSNGDSWVGSVRGDLRINAANGDIVVDRAQASVTAATANGDVRVGDLTRGTVSLKTALGQVEVGIHVGSAARLDAHTSFGRVVNEMSAADQPAPTDETVEVRARTGYGDIVIRRTPVVDAELVAGERD